MFVVHRYAHCILGILNYPMAIFGALFMAHFASIVPLTTASQATRVWNGLWLAISSPLVLLVLLSWTRMGTLWSAKRYAIRMLVPTILPALLWCVRRDSWLVLHRGQLCPPYQSASTAVHLLYLRVHPHAVACNMAVSCAASRFGIGGKVEERVDTRHRLESPVSRGSVWIDAKLFVFGMQRVVSKVPRSKRMTIDL